jgi:hypothetical protein
MLAIAVTTAEIEGESKGRSGDTDADSAKRTVPETHGGWRAVDGARRDADRRGDIDRLLADDRRWSWNEHGLGLVYDRLGLHKHGLGVWVLHDDRRIGNTGGRTINNCLCGGDASQSSHRSETEDCECLFHVLAVH